LISLPLAALADTSTMMSMLAYSPLARLATVKWPSSGPL
jgi:hypothetical protein